MLSFDWLTASDARVLPLISLNALAVDGDSLVDITKYSAKSTELRCGDSLCQSVESMSTAGRMLAKFLHDAVE